MKGKLHVVTHPTLGDKVVAVEALPDYVAEVILYAREKGCSLPEDGRLIIQWQFSKRPLILHPDAVIHSFCKNAALVYSGKIVELGIGKKGSVKRIFRGRVLPNSVKQIAICVTETDSIIHLRPFAVSVKFRKIIYIKLLEG